jgi:hypothetical protein
MTNDRTRRGNRKLAWLGLGLGMAMFGRRRLVRRLLMAQMIRRQFGGSSPWGRFGGYGNGGPAQAMNLPPFIEATLKAWHDRAHGTVQV